MHKIKVDLEIFKKKLENVSSHQNRQLLTNKKFFFKHNSSLFNFWDNKFYDKPLMSKSFKVR